MNYFNFVLKQCSWIPLWTLLFTDGEWDTFDAPSLIEVYTADDQHGNEALLIWRYVPSSGSSMGINYYYLFYSFMVSSAGSFELGHYFWEERKNMNKQWSGIVIMILTKTIITIMSRLCRQTFLFHWPAMPEDSLQIVSFISEITILSSGGW